MGVNTMLNNVQKQISALEQNISKPMKKTNSDQTGVKKSVRADNRQSVIDQSSNNLEFGVKG